ncbi:hypothetical protein HU200_052364 [Digitaria exilis]|uniref:F-box associated beta-propeller type 3 domain-containing protein n=1 Tax=Digitaria exilis TaxID=1010633 RepID=A0A835ATJ0_9POAL|nr:hypothetical protein HU200_052364 [Digitaria exilis]
MSRCVSPSWNHLISSPSFARLYHDAKAVSDPVRFVTLPVGSPRVFSGGGGMPCHGLVLAGRPRDGEFFVCNPSTGGVLLLPPRHFHSAGLGYDAAAGKHKAVLLELVGTGQSSASHVARRWAIPRLHFVVVTVGARQWRWRAARGRRTPIICEGAVVSTELGPVFADGRLHCLLNERAADGARGDLDGILVFFLDSESFKRIALPPLSMPACVTMAELDGRLGLVHDLHGQKGTVALFDVWMLRDCKALSKRNILLATKDRAYLYDSDTGVLRTVAKSSARQYMRLVLYQESFVQFPAMEYGTDDIKFEFATDKSGSGPGAEVLRWFEELSSAAF